MNKKIVLMEASQDNRKVPYMQWVRGMSCLGVVLFHLVWGYMSAQGLLREILWTFCYCTRVFFFCSGFGLYYSYLRNPVPYPAFLRKRFLNIYLPYMGVVLICFFVPYTYQYDDRIAALLSHIFLYKMFLPYKIQSFGPFWFMSAIFEYYLLFYVLIGFKNRVGNNRRFLVFWIIVSLIATAVGSAFPFIYGRFHSVYDALPFMHCCFFVLGMLAAEKLYNTGRVAISVRALAILSVGFLALYLLVRQWNTVFMNEIPTTMIVLCFFTILWAISSKWTLFRRWIYWIETFSFEWYLLHLLFADGIFPYFRNRGASAWFMGALTFAASMLAAWLYHKLVVLIKKSLAKRAAK